MIWRMEKRSCPDVRSQSFVIEWPTSKSRLGPRTGIGAAELPSVRRGVPGPVRSVISNHPRTNAEVILVLVSEIKPRVVYTVIGADPHGFDGITTRRDASRAT